MRELQKKIVSVILVLTFILLPACNKANEGGNGDSQEGIAKGRYLEESIALPENVGEIYDLTELEDGTYRLLTDNGVFDSQDEGQSWNSFEQAALTLNANEYMRNGSLSKTGEIIIICSDDEVENIILVIDKAGNEKAFEFENTYVEYEEIDPESGDTSIWTEIVAKRRAILAANGDIVALDSQNSIDIIDGSTGEIKSTIQGGGTVSSLVCIGEKILVSYPSIGVETYDLLTGNMIDTDKILSDKIFQLPEDDPTFILEVGNNEEYVNFATNEGIFHYTFGGTVLEKLVNGSLTSFSGMEYSFSSLEETKDNSYLLLVMDSNYVHKLLKYTYSAEANAVPSTEIKAYSLYDNIYLRQAIISYQGNNPDVYINLEIGVTDDDGVTVNDALRNLNTSVMAGDELDILFLDGMPIESYIEGGLLLDINDVIKEVNNTDGLFENITNTYQKGNKTFAVPARFQIPTIVGPKETLDTIEDLVTLANVLGVRGQGHTIASSDAITLLERLYPSSSITWINDDGTLNEERVKLFLEKSKNIYDVQRNAYRSHFESSSGSRTATNDDVLDWGDEMGFNNGSSNFALVNITSIEEFSIMLGMAQLVRNCTYEFMQEQSETVFIPCMVMGISAKSKKVDMAKTFMKALLSEESQSSTLTSGLPINKKAFDGNYNTLISWPTDYEFDGFGKIYIGTSYTQFLWPTEEEMEEFIDKIESLTRPSETKAVVKDTVLEEAYRYLVDEISVEEAVSNIIKKINLYLSE